MSEYILTHNGIVIAQGDIKEIIAVIDGLNLNEIELRLVEGNENGNE